MTTGAFVVSSVISFTNYFVADFAAIVLILYNKRLPSNDVFPLLVIVLLCVVDLSVSDFFFCFDAISTSSRFITSTSCAELLPVLRRK